MTEAIVSGGITLTGLACTVYYLKGKLEGLTAMVAAVVEQLREHTENCIGRIHAIEVMKGRNRNER